MKRLLTCMTLVVAIAGSVLGAGADRVRVRAVVNSETAIYPGDAFQYSIVVEGGSKPSRIDISPLQAFRPVPAGDGTSFQQFNDQVSITYSSNYQITATDVGTMHLPGVTVVVDGRTYATNAVDVTISKPGTTDRMNVEFSVAERKCYVGQPIVMTVRWIVSTRWQNVAFHVAVFTSPDFLIEDVSSAGGAQAEQVVIDGVPTTVRGTRQNVKGVESEVYVFSKVLLAQRPGRMRLDPVTVSANLAVGRVRTNSLLNPYMLDYKRMSVQSEAVELEVLPLPGEGRPGEFYGLVGQYTIEASAAPTKVSVGDPITVTIRVGGNPYLKPVRWPQLEQVPELATNFKVPSERASPTLENGFKVFTQTLRANSDAVQQIPPIPLVYFDSQAGRYVVARTDPIPLEVSPTRILTNADMEGGGAGTAGPQLSLVQAIGKGLSANYYGPEVLVDQSFSLLSAVISPGYAAIWSIPLVALVASAVVHLAGRTSPESVARKRRRQAASLALRRLKAAASAEDRQGIEQLLEAMKSYIGDRFDRVAASLTADDCRRVIAEATGDSDVAAQFGDLIAACEAARYTPLDAVGATGPQTRKFAFGSPMHASPVREATDLILAIEKRLKPAKAGFKPACTRPIVLLFAAVLTFCGPWPAARGASHESRVTGHDLYTLLNEANAAFQQGNAASDPAAARQSYERAILLYEKIIREGGVQNAGLYYNLANAHLLTDDLGRAILNYRRAERLDRSDWNIKKNLAFARSRRIDQVETGTQERVLETLFFWHYDLWLRTKLLLACLAFASSCLAMTVMIWRGRGTARVTIAALSGALAIGLLVSILIENHRQATVRFGVITASQIVARQGDGPNYPPSFKDPLHAGTEFELIEQRPGWFRIRLSDGAEAWVPQDAAEPV